jgi:hypothetical protein
MVIRASVRIAFDASATPSLRRSDASVGDVGRVVIE